LQGRCTRDNPKCKYLHPPQHLKDQLLINGRNNLALKNMLVQQIANPTLASAANTNLLAAQQAALVVSFPAATVVERHRLAAAAVRHGDRADAVPVRRADVLRRTDHVQPNDGNAHAE